MERINYALIFFRIFKHVKCVCIAKMYSQHNLQIMYNKSKLTFNPTGGNIHVQQVMQINSDSLYMTGNYLSQLKTSLADN